MTVLAKNYNINVRRYNGTDFDTLYPKTTIGQVIGGQQAIKTGNVTLTATWQGTTVFTQTVAIPGITTKSKIDIQPTAEITERLYEYGTTFLQIVNNSGVAQAVCLGSYPTEPITIQYTITETA